MENQIITPSGSAEKSSSLLAILIIGMVVVAIAGIALYVFNQQNQPVVNTATLETSPNKIGETNNSATEESSGIVDSASSLDSDIQSIDKDLTSINNSLLEADQGLNDKQTDLTE